jgi:hypothetical protein
MRRRFSSRRVVHECDTCFIVCCAIGNSLKEGRLCNTVVIGPLFLTVG